MLSLKSKSKRILALVLCAAGILSMIPAALGLGGPIQSPGPYTLGRLNLTLTAPAGALAPGTYPAVFTPASVDLADWPTLAENAADIVNVLKGHDAYFNRLQAGDTYRLMFAVTNNTGYPVDAVAFAGQTVEDIAASLDPNVFYRLDFKCYLEIAGSASAVPTFSDPAVFSGDFPNFSPDFDHPYDLPQLADGKTLFMRYDVIWDGNKVIRDKDGNPINDNLYMGTPLNVHYLFDAALTVPETQTSPSPSPDDIREPVGYSFYYLDKNDHSVLLPPTIITRDRSNKYEGEWLYPPAPPAIPGYRYVESSPKQIILVDPVTGRDIEVNVIILYYEKITDDITSPSVPLPPPSSSGDGSTDVITSPSLPLPPPTGLPITGGTSPFNLFYVGLGLLLIGIFLFASSKEGDREKKNT